MTPEWLSGLKSRLPRTPLTLRQKEERVRKRNPVDLDEVRLGYLGTLLKAAGFKTIAEAAAFLQMPQMAVPHLIGLSQEGFLQTHRYAADMKRISGLARDRAAVYLAMSHGAGELAERLEVKKLIREGYRE